MKRVALVFAISSFAVVAVACSSDEAAPVGPGTGTVNPPADASAADDVAQPANDSGSSPVDSGALDTNPDGIPYPTDNIGTSPRKGPQKGNRIANFKFLGYPKGDVAGGLQPVSLAQFWDPLHKRHRILHILVGGVWDSAGRANVETAISISAEIAAQEVVWLVALAEGVTPGKPVTDADVKKWIADLKPPFTHVLDPGNATFAPFFDAVAFPWNANIDARTMEILTSGVGGVVQAQAIRDDMTAALSLAASSTY